MVFCRCGSEVPLGVSIIETYAWMILSSDPGSHIQSASLLKKLLAQANESNLPQL